MPPPEPQQSSCGYGTCAKLVLMQGYPQGSSFVDRIYAYETALPEDLLQRGIGPLGDTKRLLKVFNKLLTGTSCTLVDFVRLQHSAPLHSRCLQETMQPVRCVHDLLDWLA